MRTKPFPTLEPPPRHVDSGVKHALRFGSLAAILGWSLFGGFMVFVWVFAAQSEALFALQFRGERESVTATVTNVIRSTWRVNSRHMHRVEFRFADELSRRHINASYTAESPPQAGDTVQVEYLAGNPALARVVGMRARPLPAPLGLIGLVPLAPLLVALVAWVRGSRTFTLLRDGVAAEGELVERSPGIGRINSRPIMRHRVRYRDALGREHETIAHTARVEDLPDGAPVLVLHDPHKPERALVPAATPGGVGLDPRGRITLARPLLGKLWLLPAAAVGVHVVVGLVLAAAGLL